MEFSSIKEMEVKLRQVTKLSDLKQDITFKSQGMFYTCKFLGIGSAAGDMSARWLDDESASSIGIVFIDNAGIISVEEVKINKFEKPSIETF